MTRRANRRRERIVELLRRHGSLPATAIAELLHRNVWATYNDLEVLEKLEGRIVGYWSEPTPGSTLRRRLWRLATDDERRSQRRRLEQLDAARQAGRTRPLRIVPTPALGGAS